MSSPELRERMLEIAVEYDRLAEFVERRSLAGFPETRRPHGA
jgi:hypothetical protein